ncbi:MAG: hypothetical protein N2Z21_10265 [Candidatus Sumerlaeaceae bacterium]|nr:hypothetical protein [Candidatus Sumerlaeaceae bacterium]
MNLTAIVRSTLVRVVVAGILVVAKTSGSGVWAAVTVETPDYLTFEYQQVGSCEEEAVRLACIRAVHATVGHVLFGEYALQGRDLLEPYLQKNWPKFVASSYVLERRASRDGFGVRVRIQTLPEVLTRDLREKRFLYLPDANPAFFVYAAELVDGQPTSSSMTRQLITDKLKSKNLKVLEKATGCPDPVSDVFACPAVFDAARVAALRNGARVMVAARSSSQKVSESSVLYETMISYETKLVLQFIRTDDASILAQDEVTARAADKEKDTALRDAVKNAVELATERFGSQIQVFWNSAVREKAAHQLLFTDLSLDELALVTSYLEATLGHGTRAFVRSYFGNAAVVGLDSPRDFSAVERALQEFKPFQLRITSRAGNRATVVCVH